MSLDGGNPATCETAIDEGTPGGNTETRTDEGTTRGNTGGQMRELQELTQKQGQMRGPLEVTQRQLMGLYKEVTHQQRQQKRSSPGLLDCLSV